MTLRGVVVPQAQHDNFAVRVVDRGSPHRTLRSLARAKFAAALDWRSRICACPMLGCDLVVCRCAACCCCWCSFMRSRIWSLSRSPDAADQHYRPGSAQAARSPAATRALEPFVPAGSGCSMPSSMVMSTSRSDDVVFDADHLLEPRSARLQLYLLHDHGTALRSPCPPADPSSRTGRTMPTQRVSFRSSVTRTHLPAVQESHAPPSSRASYTRRETNRSASASGSFCAAPRRPAGPGSHAPTTPRGSAPLVAAFGPDSCISVGRVLQQLELLRREVG